MSFNSSNVAEFFVELNSKGLYRSSGKEKESRCLVFTSYTKLEIRQFQVVVGNGTHLLKTSNFIAVVVQLPQRKVQKKRDARAKLLFCQIESKPVFFAVLNCCRRRRRRCLLKHPIRRKD